MLAELLGICRVEELVSLSMVAELVSSCVVAELVPSCMAAELVSMCTVFEVLALSASLVKTQQGGGKSVARPIFTTTFARCRVLRLVALLQLREGAGGWKKRVGGGGVFAVGGKASGDARLALEVEQA